MYDQTTMSTFYQQIRERNGKPTSGKHAQSGVINSLQAQIQSLTLQLEEHGIPCTMPSEVENDAGERTNCRREAGHTKGNTKNQRKNMKRQQRKVFSAVIEHLQNSLLSHGIQPRDTVVAMAAFDDDIGYSSSATSSDWEDVDPRLGQLDAEKRTTGKARPCCQHRIQASDDAKYQEALDRVLILFRPEPMGFLVLERFAPCGEGQSSGNGDQRHDNDEVGESPVSCTMASS
mmetsp:Transcript_83924/g.224529  ORF Transcript_83924/g.224529 Transcript_83924/m.224529 type:complete len:232 (+) Transcript_83924:391-1086(+)